MLIPSICKRNHDYDGIVQTVEGPAHDEEEEDPLIASKLQLSIAVLQF